MVTDIKQAVKNIEALEDSDKDFFDHIMYENQFESFRYIKSCCINKSCSKYCSIKYKSMVIHLCFDDWSISKSGWHEIYSETIDLCTGPIK